jgi:hypothetical protein
MRDQNTNIDFYNMVRRAIGSYFLTHCKAEIREALLKILEVDLKEFGREVAIDQHEERQHEE